MKLNEYLLALLQQAIKDCNTTQSEVGHRVGVDASEINRIVRGRIAPSSEYMLRILARLGYKITVEVEKEVILKIERCDG